MRADPFKRSDRRRWLAKPLVGAAAPATLKFRSRVWALVSGAVRSLLPTKGQKVAVASAESYRRRRGICGLCCSGVHAAAGGSHTRATCRSEGGYISCSPVQQVRLLHFLGIQQGGKASVHLWSSRHNTWANHVPYSWLSLLLGGASCAW